MKMTMPSSAPADALVKYFARWGVSTLKGALSTLTRLRTYAEAKGEYEAADNDVYSAQLVNSFLDEINVRAIESAAAYHAKAEAEGKVLTEQQKRRDGRSAARTAFRSLRYLLDNAKIATAARDPLVFKRAFGTTVPRPTPSLEPPHDVQLCYLATNQASQPCSARDCRGLCARCVSDVKVQAGAGMRYPCREGRRSLHGRAAGQI